MKNTNEIFKDETSGFPLNKVKMPRYRFEFLDDDSSVENDISIMEDWADGLISTKNATKKFRNSNLFEVISETDFVQNANWLGYFRTENCPQVKLERGTE